MNVFHNSPISLLAITAACAIAAHAQTTPTALFQYSSLTGSGATINATRVPAVDSSGNTHYWDVTLQFDVGSNGGLTLAPGSPTIVKSPVLLTADFQPGAYVGPSTINGGYNLITVSGPGTGPGGITQWSLTASPGASSCTYPSSSTWWDVGNSLARSPIASRLQAAKITYTGESYGTGGSPDCYSSPYWQTNTLMGFSQTGTILTIESYTNNGVDYNTPQDTITYTLTR